MSTNSRQPQSNHDSTSSLESPGRPDGVSLLLVAFGFSVRVSRGAAESRRKSIQLAKSCSLRVLRGSACERLGGVLIPNHGFAPSLLAQKEQSGSLMIIATFRAWRSGGGGRRELGVRSQESGEEEFGKSGNWGKREIGKRTAIEF